MWPIANGDLGFLHVLVCDALARQGAWRLLERWMPMILLGKESKLTTTEVLETAIKYFGPDGLGLDVSHWDAAHVQLQGGGGYVTVRANVPRNGSLTNVEVESREWERDAERFLGEI